MNDSTRWKVLVPFRPLEGESISRDLIEFLAAVPTVVVGYHVTPEQTAPGMARTQFEGQAQSSIDELVAELEAVGGSVEDRLVFTPDKEKSLDRVMAETGCNVLLLPDAVTDVDDLLVALRDEVAAERTADFVASIVGDRDVDVTLFHAARTEGGLERGERLVGGAKSALVEGGIDPAAITENVTVDRSPLEGLLSEAAAHDAFVVGESQPSVRSFLFGELSENLSDRVSRPVFVVLGDESDGS